MEINEKLKILSGAAKYDVSCSSSGSSRKNKDFGIGNASESGICHSFAADGRCISLLKILLTNFCIFDCTYCVNRKSSDVPRAAFTPEEIADLTINFYKRNYIEGLFLSSSVFNSPNYTMELLVRTVTLLREAYNFNGYIHLKAIPGADELLIKRAGELVDRMSVNVELPSTESLKLLAPQKSSNSIIKPMSYIGSQIIANMEERKFFKNAPSFVPAGQSTQLIIGATKDSDFKIMKLSENLYNNYNLKRVYYSAYVPVNNNPKLPYIINPPLLREHRLYQADWLLRFYGFSAGELLNANKPNLDINFDPKTDWALSNLSHFPIEINSASQRLLLRIPGIGVRSVKRIIAARRVHNLTFEDLRKLGVVLKRAQYFITCSGKYFGDMAFKEDFIRKRLKPRVDLNYIENPKYEQLTFFTGLPSLYKPEDSYSSITGEI